MNWFAEFECCQIIRDLTNTSIKLNLEKCIWKRRMEGILMLKFEMLTFGDLIQ